MPQVRSQALTEVEYDRASHTLFLRFADGDWYAYLDVPAELYAAMLKAPSKGRFFQARVRGRFAFASLGAQP